MVETNEAEGDEGNRVCPAEDFPKDIPGTHTNEGEEGCYPDSVDNLAQLVCEPAIDDGNRSAKEEAHGHANHHEEEDTGFFIKEVEVCVL